MKIITNNEIFFKRAAIVFFVAFFVVGCFIIKDYGISWDEGIQRWLGEENYNFIKTNNPQTLLENKDRFYGPAFEIFLFSAEKIFNLTEIRDIFLLRHVLSFFTFFIAVLCFYLLGFKIFKSRAVALLCAVMLVASPRIFADSFYNSKDLAMLCFCTIASYTMFLYIEKQTIWSALIHAPFCAIVLDIRIVGILLTFATLYLFIFKKEKKIIPFLVFISYTLVCIVAFWPILWLDPITNFLTAFKQMSHFPVAGCTLFYMGSYISLQELPWHYLPHLILITTPVYYIVLFLTGLFFLAKNTIINFRSTLFFHSVLFILVAPLAAVIILNSTVYDGWRHVFFVYPFLLLIAVYGFTQLIQAIKNNLTIKFIIYSTVVAISFVFVFMCSNHPFQNVYFNFLAGKNIRQNYEIDYWGLSYKQGLEYILANDKSEHINICAQNLPGYLNFIIIPPEERKRLVRVDNIQSADYFLSNFRSHPTDYNFGTSIYQIDVGGEKIMEVLKLK